MPGGRDAARCKRGQNAAVRFPAMGAVWKAAVPQIGTEFREESFQLLLGNWLGQLQLKGRKARRVRHEALFSDRIKLNVPRGVAASPKLLGDLPRCQLQSRTESAIVKASVNNEFVMWDDPFSDGDTVTFLPPFSGG